MRLGWNVLFIVFYRKKATKQLFTKGTHHSREFIHLGQCSVNIFRAFLPYIALPLRLISHKIPDMKFCSFLLLSLLISGVLTGCSPDATGRKDNGVKTTSNLTARAVDAPQTNPALGLCSASVTHQERVIIPPVSKPPHMRYFRDPAFGSKVIRITNSVKSQAIKPVYSTMQAWNADESRLILYQTGTSGRGHMLHDGRSYEFIKKLDISPVDLEQIWWSKKDPNSLFYVSDADETPGHFLRFNPDTGKKTLIKDLSTACPNGGIPNAGGDVQMQSDDDDLFAFRCDNGGKTQTSFSYRLSNDEIIQSKIGDGTKWHNRTAPAATPSGEYLYLQGTSLKNNLNVHKELDIKAFHNHGSIGKTHDGYDAMYQIAFGSSPKGCSGDLWKGVGHVIQHNLETGACRPIVGQTQGYPYPTSGTHISALSTEHPGWLVGSSIGKSFEWFSNGRKAPMLFSEIYLANTNPANPVVCRLAHHRSLGKAASNEGYSPYFGEPHASISPSGTRIIYGSDWYDSGAVDTYVLELPMYSAPEKL